MKIRQITAIRLSGAIWLAVGLMLMLKGMPLLVLASTIKGTPLIQFLLPFTGTAEQASMVLTVLGLLLGFIKGKTVLTKAARKAIGRVRSLEDPLRLSKLYAPRYYLLLGLMMGMGLSLRFFGAPADIHGLIDLAVGSALINGGLVYFREGSSMVGRPTTNL